MIPVQADIEQGECIRRDPAPYEPITYHVPLDADLQQYTAEMCDLYEVPLELAYAVMQVESGYTVSATSSTGDYGLMQINSINAGYQWFPENAVLDGRPDDVSCGQIFPGIQRRRI